MKIDTSKIVDIELDGIDHKDYPDFCNSYISKGYINLGNKQFRELSEDELEYINNNERDWVYQKVIDYIH